MIDLHTHVLPGIDDGPADLEGSLAMARAAVEAGTRVMAATPHIGLHYPVVPGELSARVAELRGALHATGIQLDVVVGGELAASAAAELAEEELRAIALDGGSCVLLECPFTRLGWLMPALVSRLHRMGFRVLLAHPERSPDFLQEPASLLGLLDAGAFVQVTAASLHGDFGRRTQRYALALLEEGLIHVVASDAHDAAGRSPAVLPIVRHVVRRQALAPDMTRFVTEDGPRALLDGTPVPPPPARRRGAQRLRR